MLSFDIADQHAVVIGCGGIGTATAVAMAELGAHLTVADHSLDAATACADSLGGRPRPVEVDVRDATAVEALFAGLDHPADIVVNTAGVIDYTDLVDQDEGELQRILDVNLRGSFLCVQHAARQMRSVGRGSIVNLSSVAAFASSRLPAAAYAMTKAGVRQLTVSAAAELAGSGVRVNAVAPATIETPFVQGTLDTAEQREAAAARSPLGRIGTPADVVGAVVFLASPLASFITGHTLVVDGGRLTRTR